MPPADVPITPASTVLLVMDSADGVEVLMVKRPPVGFFGGLMAFPGGAVEPVDSSELAVALTKDDSDDPYRMAALRELAEETGLVLATEGVAVGPDLQGTPLLQELAERRTLLNSQALVLVSRWITPEYAPRRFDAWFYIAKVEDPPAVRLDRTELADHAWVTAEDALRRQASGEWRMFRPTLAHLDWLSEFGTAGEAVLAARGAAERELDVPDIMDDGSMVSIRMPSGLK